MASVAQALSPADLADMLLILDGYDRPATPAQRVEWEAGRHAQYATLPSGHKLPVPAGPAHKFS